MMRLFRELAILNLLLLIAIDARRLHSNAMGSRKLRHWHENKYIDRVTGDTDPANAPLEIYGTDWIIICPDPDGTGKGFLGGRRTLKGSKKGLKGSKGISKGEWPPLPYPPPGGSKSSDDHYIFHPRKFHPRIFLQRCS